jgi:hypothetical protein
VEELFTKLNGVLPAQKELDAFSAELNLSGSQVREQSRSVNFLLTFC